MSEHPTSDTPCKPDRNLGTGSGPPLRPYGRRICAISGFLAVPLLLAAGCGDDAVGSSATEASAGSASEAGTDTQVGSDTHADVDTGTDTDTDTSTDTDTDTAPQCDPLTGMDRPSDLCSASRPCESPTGLVSVSTDLPTCVGSGFDDGPPITRLIHGGERHHCYYAPPNTGPDSRRPLVVFLHGGYGLADGAYNNGIRASAEEFDLSGDPTRAGFMMVSVQSRNLGFHVESPIFEGALHEFWYWDLAQPSTNPDFANLDALIDDMVEIGADPERIYVMGHSAGGLFAQLYGMARSGPTTTPAGHRVAAASIYSAANPLKLQFGAQPCERATPTTTFPIFTVSRSCDIVACDAAQRDQLQVETGGHGGGFPMTEWDALYPPLEWVLVNGVGLEVFQCDPQCDQSTAVFNHLRWPQTKHDDMLDFLREHPLLP